MRSNKLTNKQTEVLAAIINFIDNGGLPPTYRDLMSILNLKSPSTIKTHLDQLKYKGYITWEPGLPRTLRIIKHEKTA
ncbi:transcriptional regulator [Bacillus idriensis]|uniref:Transcriptional regulator n=1 Tax=Metabacillus idriensis TaxID=324768 RepID=A0A6I2MBZ0_9BACI|nr:transcriptional regulator [Metabacillus idriensis]MRX54864.1 transcriptional regulator [Metabacillus idriensis]